jgi:hypothetical protein
MDPVIAEILRARRGDPIRADVLVRWQRHLQNEVQPRLDRLASIEARVDELERAPSKVQDVMTRTGLSRTTIWRRRRAGKPT